MKAEIKFQHEMLAVEEEHDVHVMLELEAPEAPAAGDRAPLRVALVMDRSGSMTGQPLETVKQCAHYLVDRLDAHDRIALITYDDKVGVLAGMTPPEPQRLHALIDAISPGGMTNLSGGWLKGLEEADRYVDGVRRVLLLTDGLANEGIVDPPKLTAIAASTAAQGVSTTTIGVGDGFAEELLTDVASAGRGRAWYAESVEDLPGIFSREFDDLVSVVAQNVSVELRPTEDVQLVGILNDFPAAAVEGGVQLVLGDAFGGQRLRVVFTLHIPHLARLGLRKVADVVLRYVTVGDSVATHEETLPVTVNAVTADEADAAGGDPNVAEEVTVLSAARATQEARRLADRGDRGEAAELLRRAADDLRIVAPRSGGRAELLRQAGDLDRTVAELATDAYSVASSKRLHYRAHDMRRGRSSHDDDGRRMA